MTIQAYQRYRSNLNVWTSKQNQSEGNLESSEESGDTQEVRDGSALPGATMDTCDVFEVASFFAGDWTSDLEGGSDGSWNYSDIIAWYGTANLKGL